MRTHAILFSIATVVATLTAHAQQPVNYRIEQQQPVQTILHFGASDAWSAQFVGLWPQEQQEQIADWLFSTQNDASGKPKGIGLSLWRFNLGAGSAEQGDSSKINPGTRTECLLCADGSYNWTKQRGQRNFMQLAKTRGVPHFLAFLNSAPVYFTDNGLATNTGRGNTINLKKGKEKALAQFAATALKGIERHDGIHFDYFSPINEPQWSWQGPKQEGSPATNEEVARVVEAVSSEFKRQGMDTQIAINECADLRFLLGEYQGRGNELRAFFSKSSTQTYLGNKPGVLPAILAHDYWTNTPVEYMRQIREQLRDTLRQYGIPFWQSEVCIMSNDKEIGGGPLFDFSMLTALYVARLIHYDLVYGNAVSWSWWRAIGGNYRDGLVRVFSTDGMKSGRALPSKLMWALGNYSRFVRPGAVRFDVSALDAAGNAVEDGATEPGGLMVSAYKNADGSWVVVAINYSEQLRPFKISGIDGDWIAYRTSDAEDESLKPVGTVNSATMLEPRSVTTFVRQR